MAERVAERILRVAQRRMDPVQVEGLQIEQALATPMQGAAMPEGMDEAMIYRALGL